MSDETTLSLREAAPGVQIVAFNRPNAANSLSTAMGRELLETWTRLGADPTVRVAILTGEGRFFCAGADLKERNGMTDAAWGEQHRLFEDMIAAQLACPFPIIAAVNGAAMGGGTEMTLACDFAFASETARLGLPEAGLGIVPGPGGTQLLVRAAGPRRASELLMSGRHITAAEAVDYGIVNRLFPAETLLEETIAFAKLVASKAPLSVKALKVLMRDGPALPLAEAMALELSHYNFLFTTADRREGVAAFNESRTAQFQGR
jgi:enoyl-CoA hydratase